MTSVFYMDQMITVEKDDEGDWDELLPALAVPIRALNQLLAQRLPQPPLLEDRSPQ